MKSYELTYWKGEDDESGKFVVVPCLLEEESLKVLLSDNPPKFFQFIIDDGEKMIIPTDNINSLKEVFEKINNLKS